MECNVKGVNVYYEEAGSGMPLLLLHGLPLDHRHMHYSYEPLFTERPGWRRIYPDLPGFGRTRAADWITSQDDMLDVVISFMDQVAPGERFAVAGLSYGGYMTRGVVHHVGTKLLGAMFAVPSVETDATKTNLPPQRVLREDPEFLAALQPDEQDMRGFIVMQSMALLHTFRAVISPAVAIADQEFLKRLNQHYAFSFDLNALAEPFSAPTMILTGRQDNWCGYREAYQLLDSYPRASFAVLDCAGHALWVEQETLFRALTSDWLDRVEAYTHCQ